MTSATELLDRAAGHLHAAAQQADELGRLYDSASLRAFAGQIRLNAAGLSGEVNTPFPLVVHGALNEKRGTWVPRFCIFSAYS